MYLNFFFVSKQNWNNVCIERLIDIILGFNSYFNEMPSCYVQLIFTKQNPLYL